ncbi:hypothetical protein KR767_04100 [Luteibacter anthropi]|uniref:hypothetical protein n=1 Tax=Luteibacter anthropi TaxID=564369 RepID=UPI002032CE9D|nr:hypothetical protein [Luteibacter anthropi]URX63259.1 hypothetical protein KR767_04100 [Luteibacter anthropi]
MTLADYQTRVADLVRDRDAVITDVQRDDAVRAAFARYSAVFPRPVVVDLVSTGGQRIELPGGFTSESTVVALEYPVGQIPPIELPLSEVRVYTAPTQRLLDLPLVTRNGDVLRMTYTAAHLVDGIDDTVLPAHRQAVASLAASMLCGQLVSYYSSEMESTISADAVNYKDKAQRFRQRAKDLEATFVDVVGDAPSDRAKAASATVGLERRNALGGRRLFHPTRDWAR